MSGERTEVGEFTMTAEGVITGPAAYMESEEFRRQKELVETGRCPVVRQGVRGSSPSPEVAILVSFQTSYAGWKGQQQLAAALGSS